MKTKPQTRNRKSSMNYKKILSAGTLLALVGAGFILLRSIDRRAIEHDTNSTESAPERAQMAPKNHLDSPKVKNDRAAQPIQSAKTISIQFQNAKSKNTSILKIQDQIFESHPEFEEIWFFSQKVLHNKSDFKRVEAILSDRTLLRKFSEFLNLVPESNVDRNAQLTRIYSLNALKLAASWKENPARGDLGELLRDAFTQPLSRADMHEDLKRSLVADKFELWAILKANFPNIANEIRQSEREEQWQKLIDAADKFAG